RDFHVTGVQTCALPISQGDGRSVQALTVQVQIRSMALNGTGTVKNGRGHPESMVRGTNQGRAGVAPLTIGPGDFVVTHGTSLLRSEERRVGKQCRSRW